MKPNLSLNLPTEERSMLQLTTDQFLSNQSNTSAQSDLDRSKSDEMQKMFLMFQKMATDPSLFMQMMSSVSTPQSQPEPRRIPFQPEQQKFRNQELSQGYRDVPLPVPSQEPRKRATDVLGRSSVEDTDDLTKYCNPSQQRQSQKQARSQPGKQQEKPAKKEDAPISSTYAMKQSQLPTNRVPEEQPKYLSDDDRPIKPAKGYNYDAESNQSSIANNSMVSNIDKYYEAENRPIKGIQGDFKAYIMKEQGFPMSEEMPENEDEDNENSPAPKAKVFLKKGSRQHLSSAIERSVSKAKPKPKAAIAKEQLDLSSSNIRDSEKPERSISQNRILGRKSISSKSISKSNNMKTKQDEGSKSIKYSQKTTYQAEPKSPRVTAKQQKNFRQEASPTFKTDADLKPKKQKKRNIFQDSSSDEQTQKSTPKTENKTEVIPGVYLSKRQLHQILTKHGKGVPQTQENESQLNELKKKYVDLCSILAEEKQMFEQHMQQEKEEFEKYKQNQINKIKNQRKVQERNMLANQKTKEKEREKDDFQALKRVLEKEREEFRHKEKNYKIMIEKYKKAAEEKEKTGIQTQKIDNFETAKSEDMGTTNRKQGKIGNKSEIGNIEENDSVKISSTAKGTDENSYSSFNRRETRQNESQLIKQKEKNNEKGQLPSYQDLKKPPKYDKNEKNTTNSIKPEPPKREKYEYYEENDQKETMKPNFGYKEDSDQEPDHDHEEDMKDKEEIVQYNPSMKLQDLTKIPLTIKMVTDEMVNNLFRCKNNPEYKKYLQLTRRARTKIHTSRNGADRKVTNVYADGGKQVIFDTGVRKQYFSNGYVIIFFANGDIKQKLGDETILYFYQEKEVDQITLSNGTNIYRFENNQVEFHYPDKSVEIRHPDGTIKVL